jgi:hypothetical protein
MQDMLRAAVGYTYPEVKVLDEDKIYLKFEDQIQNFDVMEELHMTFGDTQRWVIMAIILLKLSVI